VLLIAVRTAVLVGFLLAPRVTCHVAILDNARDWLSARWNQEMLAPASESADGSIARSEIRSISKIEAHVARKSDRGPGKKEEERGREGTESEVGRSRD